MIPNGLAYLVVEVSDKFLMSRLLNKEILGIYSANYRFGTALLLVVMAFRTAWQPFFLKIAEQSDAKTVYAKVLTYFVMIYQEFTNQGKPSLSLYNYIISKNKKYLVQDYSFQYN